MSALALHRNVPVARRQLGVRGGRTLAAVLGIAASLLLVLALRAIFAGLEARLTAYIDGTGADVIVAQESVETMHMTQSALPGRVVEEIRRVPGVARADGLLYRAAFLEGADGTRKAVAIVAGGPARAVVAGRRPHDGEIVVDRVAASELGVGVGSTVEALGARLRVSGEVAGTAAINGSYAFTTRATLARLLRLRSVVSYVLVYGRRGTDPATLAREIGERVPSTTAVTRTAFAASERRAVGDMSTDIVRVMTLIAFVIGIAVAGLIAYAQTLAQLPDYGVLRAIGLTARRAVLLALAQVGAVVAGGFVVAVAAVSSLAVIVPLLSPTLVLVIRAVDVVQAAGVAVAVAFAAAAIPVIRVVRLDPASVFRRAS
jgi:putative ABC transport system permease protein